VRASATPEGDVFDVWENGGSGSGRSSRHIARIHADGRVEVSENV
jgi:hypothetical protein